MTKRQLKAMQKAIDLTWQDPTRATLRQRLFPEGKPSVDLFIARVAAYAQICTCNGSHVDDVDVGR